MSDAIYEDRVFARETYYRRAGPAAAGIPWPARTVRNEGGTLSWREQIRERKGQRERARRAGKTEVISPALKP
jgi:hypothetical protein